MADERKSHIRNSRTRRKRAARVEKSEAPVQVPLRFRAAFANYLLHGMSPEQAKLRVAADMSEIQECV